MSCFSRFVSSSNDFAKYLLDAVHAIQEAEVATRTVVAVEEVTEVEEDTVVVVDTAVEVAAVTKTVAEDEVVVEVDTEEAAEVAVRIYLPIDVCPINCRSCCILNTGYGGSSGYDDRGGGGGGGYSGGGGGGYDRY